MLGRRQGELIKYDLDTGEMIRDENGFAVKCEVGETGLLICEINQLNVFAGYVNNPQATEERFMHNVLKEGFDPSVVKNPLYFLNPDQDVYVELTPDRYAKIIDHTIKF